MSPSPSVKSPWPTQTAPPSISHARSKRLARPDGLSRSHPPSDKRQNTIISDADAVAQAKYNCEIYANNNNVTCYPDAGDQVFQHQWAAVVWNSKRPQIDQYNLVNLYLFNADTQVPLFTITNVTNPTGVAGQYNVPVNDSWFGEEGLSWNGQNLSYPFYWIVTDQNGLDGSQTTNPTFYAIQTTYADSVASSMSSASLSSISAQSTLSAMSVESSLSSLSSQSTASVSASASASSSNSASSGSIQPSQGNSAFPHWAIAVIVVLGFLAIVAGGVLIWLIMRRLRRRERLSNRGSMGSSSPMMANAQNSNSPQLPLLAGAGMGAAAGRASSEQHRPASIVSPDGASEISRAHSAGDSGPFSGADAAIMADAFRKALRKPDFAGAPVEEAEDRKDDAIMNRELAEEGRDIRSVSSSRGVKVETLNDGGDTVQNH